MKKTCVCKINLVNPRFKSQKCRVQESANISSWINAGYVNDEGHQFQHYDSDFEYSSYALVKLIFLVSKTIGQVLFVRYY